MNPDKELQVLEQTLDLVQPGWRDELIVSQYLPKITVCHDFMHTKRQQNPGPAVPEIKGLYVAGEWATHGELLVDAATASAKRAVQHILSQESKERSDTFVSIETLYKAYKTPLFSLAYRMLGSVMDAEDIVQEAFLSYDQLPNANDDSK